MTTNQFTAGIYPDISDMATEQEEKDQSNDR